MLTNEKSDPSKSPSYEWCVEGGANEISQANANANHRDGESITSSVTAYREENGRTYHAYSDGCTLTAPYLKMSVWVPED